MESDFISTLPENVARVLTSFLADTRSAFANDLVAVVLYGSAAEGKLRPTSDVNLLLVLSAFNQKQADQLREPLRLAQAAIKLRTMFLLQSEIQPAMKAFAVKFGDILRRRRVLHGEDPFAGMSVSREDSIIRLKQTLLNLNLRLREAYITRGLREEQLVAMIADLAGPLRSCAATLLELEGRPVESGKDSLQQVAASLPLGSAGTENVARISEARQNRTLPPGTAAATCFQLMELTHAMWTRANALS